ncbi:MAG: branched-chain amino acid ABC transporter permease, partial [Thermodesulfobacteriota bacterium]|nr:branched-chain amino acid ABC transporter permease [Thermodesulfobacteriota bacterium]
GRTDLVESSNLIKHQHLLYVMVLVLVLAILPLFMETSYCLLVLNVIGLNTMVVVGLNLLVGYAGQISMGHAAFYGMGAYVSAVATTNMDLYAWSFPWLPGWSLPWLIIVVAMLLTGAVAYLIGIPTLRLKGNYLVMATLGLNIIFEIVLVEWDSLTGGANGMAGIPHLEVGGFQFDSDLKFYFLIWGLSLVALLASLSLVDSRVGRALRAIHGSEVAANTLGINTHRYKVKVFVLSAMFASLAGSLYAHYITVITPKSCDIVYSIQVVIMVIVGGLGSVWGSLFGAVMLTLLSEVLHIVEKFNVVAMGLILMVVMIFFPEGFIPGILNLIRKRRAPSAIFGEAWE